MSILNVKNLSHGFGARVIFEDVSFRLLQGEHVGLIGANGEGKSTFMNIVTGKLMPDKGEIEWSKRFRAGYLDQHTVLEKGKTVREVLRDAYKYLFELEAEMNEIFDNMATATEDELEAQLIEVGDIQHILDHNDFYIIDIKINEIARGLGVMDIGMDNDVSELSGGQRTKVLLSKLLLEKPEILLLDEPTNFLDEVHIEWLKRYLLEYENAFILISHDIPFLNSVINLVYHMGNGELNRYVGDYNNFEKLHEAKKKQVEAAYKKQQQEITNLKDFVQRNKARIATRNMAMSRQKKLDKMEKIELIKEKPKPTFNFKKARTSGKELFETKDLIIGYDEPLSSKLNIAMERGQKIAIKGANGIGKTTLLRSILGEIKSLNGNIELGQFLYIGYFEQEFEGDGDNTCIEEIWSEFPSMTQYEVRATLAKCGLTKMHIESKIRVLSGGEQAKVRLCKLINRESNFLVLDEPTNHLDIDAKEELKRALKVYSGSILMISHEPEFYEDIATDIWDANEWTTKIV
ncbi:ABC-F family ATP-binding cassette domain-containing protein [Clostridiaceae bacterium HSG29]|nr:ABC-F family ATP-binding cassette domain-containing protein [Clostridiaceae bacterium HSG29]